MTQQTLSAQEHFRYSRQIMIPSIGEKGQQRLKKAKVFVAGLGGLGTVSAYYLAAAGVGHLKLIDKDHVGLENLNRQLLHYTQDIGRPKTESAHDKLSALNPLCRLDAVNVEIRYENVRELIGDCDIIVDATDNFETRKCLNAASISQKKPFIFGGVDGFNGMVTTFIPGETPCLECLFPGTKTSSGKISAIGPIPGIIGAIQSLEAIKIAINMTDLLKNTLLHINGMNMSFRKTWIERDPDCGCCKTREWMEKNG